MSGGAAVYMWLALVERLSIEGMLENDCGVGREWSLEEHSAENDRNFEKKKNKNDRTHMMIASTKMIRISIGVCGTTRPPPLLFPFLVVQEKLHSRNNVCLFCERWLLLG